MSSTVGDISMNTTGSQELGQLSKYLIQPERVAFGTYDCKIPNILIIISESLKYLNVPQNDSSQEIEVNVPFSEVEVLQVRNDKQL